MTAARWCWPRARRPGCGCCVTRACAPEVVVSGADETNHDGLPPAGLVADLAARKAEAVAAIRPEALVLGCDSMLDLDGESAGQAADRRRCHRLWHRLRGRAGTLLTGHCLIGGGRTASAVGATIIRFGTPSDAEIAAYAATSEPLALAGGFSIDGAGRAVRGRNRR